ncbi:MULTISPECIES: type II toxin-antitoxin system RelE/ParE family toxin [Rhizobium]|uniref:Type II toxin-antitoxin system RelE/ParE family toxin n=1 Tax=Rhizobium anhuiense TaxID=1184720 RepID=A0A432NX51_9HYPH|nr:MULTISPECIES: type II toxin-antitoxin system RelE/ParE family toxin [Rhizobium]MBB4213279.1 plasmid stabilization system protein ParE [Rhizobium sp. BK212]MBB3742630.1 plasmid stabilization system protein ParE [Rhizobium sp. BK591]NKM55194.1 hypothetical protein [Rhizobium anhuiense]PDS39878.1 hypothetical protein CO665_00060 [Rhizobium anhuiense]PDS59502.1 hypothetical protein CO663_05890 [Rhizobium anhuiense]
MKKIYADIAREQPQAAERYFRRFREKAMLLIDQPRLGSRQRDISPSARMLVEAPYVILYETHPDTDQGPVELVERERFRLGANDTLTTVIEWSDEKYGRCDFLHVAWKLPSVLFPVGGDREQNQPARQDHDGCN